MEYLIAYACKGSNVNVKEALKWIKLKDEAWNWSDFWNKLRDSGVNEKRYSAYELLMDYMRDERNEILGDVQGDVLNWRFQIESMDKWDVIDKLSSYMLDEAIRSN